MWFLRSKDPPDDIYLSRLTSIQSSTTNTEMTVNGGSLLNAIGEGNCIQLLNLLDSGGIDLEQKDQNGQTPLIIASEKGNVEIVHELLKRNVQVNEQDEDGWTALVASCKEGHYEVVKELLEYGAKVQLTDLGGWSPLVWAAYKGHAEIVKELLDHGADPNERGQHGMTALIWASGRGHTHVVKHLLNAGANPDAADKYGTTALVWGCRKGHLGAVKCLLGKNANVDTASSRGWTPLIMAAKGGYSDVVECLLEQEPHINATDQEGNSALAWSAKHGHQKIVQRLLARGAHFNLPDKEGETVLISAARDGHLEVVRALLNKYADVEAADCEKKTALFHAVEKGHALIVKELLDAGANTEAANKDGETPLLRATQKKHSEIVLLLLEKGANVSVADKRGDTAVHIGVRGRYRRICELLLRNPKDARLLYRPNKAGETPYNIDRQHKHSILTQIFGTGLFTSDKKCSEEVMGYDVYTSALADVLCEPSLTMPLTVGIYARWGSGKSFVLRKLQDEMREFAHQDLRAVFHFSRLIFCLLLVFCSVVGVVLWATVSIAVGVAVAIGIFMACYLLFLCAYMADKRYERGEASCGLGGYVSKAVATMKLLCQLIFCIPPCSSALKPTLGVRFLFTDFSKMTCGGSEAASLVGMIETLCDVVENEFGFFVTRLYRVFRSPPSEYDDVSMVEARWKRCCCCVPTFAVFLIILALGVIGLVFFKVYGTDANSVITGLEIASASIVGVAVLVHLPTLCSILYSLIFSQKKRITVVATQLGLKEEGFIHALKQEVELLTDLVNCVDGFTRHQTRIVILIDGLDNSEQSKVLQLLDSVNLLFTDPDAPFIILMALDPRVIIRAIDQSFSSILRESHISASDYLKSIVQLPFYLPEPKSNYTGVLSSAVVTLLEDMRGNINQGLSDRASLTVDDLEWDGEMLELNDEQRRVPRDMHNCNGGVSSRVHPDLELHSSMLYEVRETDHCLDHQKLLDRELELEERRRLSADLAQVLADNEAVNPFGVKRLMNVVSLTGRLLRARGIEYSWKRLAAWVSLVDGWPYKTSWLVLLIEDSNTRLQDHISLKDLYEATLSAMPVINEVDCTVDGDPVYFETFLASHQPFLSTFDVRRFLSCTIHLDPSLRRQMVECLQSSVQMTGNKSDTGSIGKVCAPLKADNRINLLSLNIEDVCKQISELDGLDQKQISTYQSVITQNNINGKVLTTCDLNELGHVMAMTFGDWQLFRSWILAARNPGQACTLCHMKNRCGSPGEMNCQPLKTSSATPVLSFGSSVKPIPTESPAPNQAPAPDIVLLPPSAPASDDEDNSGSLETKEMCCSVTKIDDEVFDEGSEITGDVERNISESSQTRTMEDSLLINIEEDNCLPPLPVILPMVYEDDDDLPAPPPCGADLITFSESEDQRGRSDHQNDVLNVELHELPPENDWKNTQNVETEMECTCESVQPLDSAEMSEQERKPSKNSLFDDASDSEQIGRPTPIIVTVNRGGPVKSAVAIRRRNSSSGSSSPSSPLPDLGVINLASATTPLSLPSGQHSFSESNDTLRLQAANNTVTVENPPKHAKTTETRPRFSSDSELARVGKATASMLPESTDRERDFHYSDHEFDELPSPPPPIGDHPTLYQEDSPWVPLMTRFNVDGESLSVSGTEEPLLSKRRPRPKTSSGVHESRPPKFRSYTPKPKPTYVEVKNSQPQNQKSETCV